LGRRKNLHHPAEFSEEVVVKRGAFFLFFCCEWSDEGGDLVAEGLAEAGTLGETALLHHVGDVGFELLDGPAALW